LTPLPRRAAPVLMELTTPLLALLVLVLTLAASALVVQHDLGSPLLAALSLPLRTVCYALLFLGAGGTVAYDWSTVGPLLALKRGAAATLVAWILLVPLGEMLESVIHAMWFLGLLGLGALASFAAYMTVPTPWNPFAGAAIMLVSWVLASHGEWFGELQFVFGPVLIFSVVLTLARIILKSETETKEQTKEEPITSWSGVAAVERECDEFRECLDTFTTGCIAYAHKYPFELQLAALYRVEKIANNSNQDPLVRIADGRHRHLFHGTKRKNARGIVANGFTLPNHHGMFGKGIYFADCPLKSWGYTDGKMLKCNGLILMCWVELGRESHQKKERTGLTRPPHRSFIEWVRGKERYSSVVGDDKETGGALRVPEYIVYDPAKVRVDYICEVKCVPPGTPPDEQTPRV